MLTVRGVFADHAGQDGLEHPAARGRLERPKGTPRWDSLLEGVEVEVVKAS